MPRKVARPKTAFQRQGLHLDGDDAGGGDTSAAEADDSMMAQLADIDALLARSEAAIAEAKAPGRSRDGDGESLV